MLYSIDSGSYITSIPHKKDFERWRSRLTDSEYRTITEELNRRIDGSEIQTSSWIPGKDWSITVFAPIYDGACLQDEQVSAKFFGLILWHVMMEHPDTWAFGRYAKEAIPIEGLTYFKINPPRK
jgi:hypothetical protein